MSFTGRMYTYWEVSPASQDVYINHKYHFGISQENFHHLKRRCDCYQNIKINCLKYILFKNLSWRNLYKKFSKNLMYILSEIYNSKFSSDELRFQSQMHCLYNNCYACKTLETLAGFSIRFWIEPFIWTSEATKMYFITYLCAQRKSARISFEVYVPWTLAREIKEPWNTALNHRDSNG